MGDDAEPDKQPPPSSEQPAEPVTEQQAAADRPVADQWTTERPAADQSTGLAAERSAAGTDPAATTSPLLARFRARQRAATDGAAGRRRRSSRLELPILIVIAIAIAIVLKTFVVQPFYIPSQSMEQTLHGCPTCAGDRILVFKPVFKVRDPHPGDVVVFKAPADWDGAGVTLSSNPVAHGVQWFGQLIGVVPPSEKDLVKRVIAIGGQTVRCCDDNGNVQVSDHGATGPWRSLNEPYIYQNSPWTPPTTPGVRGPDDSRTFGPVTVPAGRLWVMGDHRNDSADSRYHCGDPGPGPNCDPLNSTVPVSDVIGKAVVIAWPPSRWRTLGTPKTFTSLGLPGLGALPAEPAAFAVAGVGLVGWRRRRRR